MKTVFALGSIFVLFFVACSKTESAQIVQTEKIHPEYDTTAIDSFSAGAISVDIARKIRMSSQAYQDSLKEVLKVETEVARLKKEELEKEKKEKDLAEKTKAKETVSSTPTP